MIRNFLWVLVGAVCAVIFVLGDNTARYAIVGILGYFLPGFVAIARHKRNKNAILLVNLLLGWTIVGWIVALVWAVTVDAPSPEAPASS